jgi:hypothetical protein
MSDGLNAIPVLHMHLEELERTLDFVEGLLVAQDLQADYRKMSTATTRSRLTQKVQEQRERLQGYLSEGVDVSEE